MAQNYFQFKHFRIEQSHCAQKVSTDACIFGAFLAKEAEGKLLEVGSGTGLLAFMVAQNNSCDIVGVEIQEDCWKQSLENLKSLDFDANIQFYHADIRAWKNEEKFDFIFSNPPFYENLFPSAKENTRVAKHADSLAPEDWMKIIESHAHPNTRLGFILSDNPLRTKYEKILKSKGFRKYREIRIADRPEKTARRILSFWSYDDAPLEEEIFTIKNAEGDYSPEMTQLMKDYYLYL